MALVVFLGGGIAKVRADVYSAVEGCRYIVHVNIENERLGYDFATVIKF